MRKRPEGRDPEQGRRAVLESALFWSYTFGYCDLAAALRAARRGRGYAKGAGNCVALCRIHAEATWRSRSDARWPSVLESALFWSYTFGYCDLAAALRAARRGEGDARAYWSYVGDSSYD